MYEFYLGNMLLPVTPSKLTTKINNQNKTYNLIDDGEINILKSAGLTEIEFDCLLPNVHYPFAVYKDGFQTADVFLNQIEKLKTDLKPFQFIVVRNKFDGNSLFNTNMKVSLESYTIKEDAETEGVNINVNIKLKQYREFSTKTCNITIKKQATLSNTRETTNSPEPKNQNQYYTVVKGDCLWSIAKKFYGDGSKYGMIYNANKDKIKNPNLIYPGQVLLIPIVGTVSNAIKNTSNKKSTSNNPIAKVDGNIITIDSNGKLTVTEDANYSRIKSTVKSVTNAVSIVGTTASIQKKNSNPLLISLKR